MTKVILRKRRIVPIDENKEKSTLYISIRTVMLDLLKIAEEEFCEKGELIIYEDEIIGSSDFSYFFALKNQSDYGTLLATYQTNGGPLNSSVNLHDSKFTKLFKQERKFSETTFNITIKGDVMV